MNEDIFKELSNIKHTMVLLEANGRIDGRDGKDRNRGWIELCEEMGVPPFGHHASFRTAYENGWYEGWQNRKQS